ncbi:Acetyl-coenzyme A carboxyl transferase alpha chain / Acetyl-coenzyme A carboxyl transferase beta chain [Lachnospiraceae bacterium TWA4]|nr:Acetyl-coenzyme A carboxyl transferase alpha chain / Acetyl-coenzyme A carboxyl transferase beta chain [Lachnospiraceae bacterium TWA4]
MNDQTARMRIQNLLDEGSFVEIGSLVTARATNFNLQEKTAPSDGVITGYGTLNERLVYIYSQDSSVLNGTMGEMHAKKIQSLYAMAMKMKAPIIGFIDSAGLRLEEAVDALEAFGQLYFCQVQASGVIPQITAIFGACGGGMAVVPSLTDFTFMEETKGKLFVNAPHTLVNATYDEDLSSANFQSKVIGSVDGVGSEEEILTKIAQLIEVLPSNNEETREVECMDDLNRLCEDYEAGMDNSYLVSQIADNYEFLELKEAHAKDMGVGFMRLNGNTVGVVFNKKEVLTSKGCLKAAKFVNLCDAFNIPILTLTNVTSYQANKHQERKLPDAIAALTKNLANATVPKINVITGSAIGSSAVVMNSKAIGADLVMAYETSKVGLMDAKSAVRIMYADEIKASTDAVSLINEKAKIYEEECSSALAAAKRGYVDMIIEPKETRKHVIAAFEMLYTKQIDSPERKHMSV